MLQLKNNTPFAAIMTLLPNENGIDTLFITVKATFALTTGWVLLDDQPPPQAEDVYWGKPGESSLRYASDIHLGKPCTDIVMIGNAVAPTDQRTTCLDVDLNIGVLKKTLRVFGDREWRNGRITSPQPFEIMPMVYERAFGGRHVVAGQIESAESRNPIGVGYAGARSVDEINGLLLPNLEDPAQLIRTYSDQPAPACFGFYAANWQPRAAYVGSYDEAWQQTRAPYLPEDFNKRFFNMAHPDLIYPGYLQGGEPVHVTHMHSRGPLQFEVPRVRLSVKALLDDVLKQPVMNMETLTLEPNDIRLSMVWKGAVPCDKQTLKIREVTISLTR